MKAGLVQVRGYGLLDKTNAAIFSDPDDRLPSARKWVYGSKDYLRSNAYELGFLEKDWVPIADFALLYSPCWEYLLHQIHERIGFGKEF